MGRKFEPIERPSNPALDQILGKALPVLDDGFVRLIDYMGDDAAIVQAARVSYGKGTKKTRSDRSLIRYLLRHRHTSPFEMCEIKLHLRVPMDCWRQWIRHRTANVNEYSTRYSIAIQSMQRTANDAWRVQSESNKQGSEGFIDEREGEVLSREEEKLHDLARSIYEDRIARGIAREQARKDLPLSTYTEAYWKIDLNNLLHFLHLRMAENAQYEIRQYATIIGQQIVKSWCPLTWEAFEDYWTGAMILSKTEQEILDLFIAGRNADGLRRAREVGWLRSTQGQVKEDLEWSEFIWKCRMLGVNIPEE
jgi:thymidylate synthase (FAD)